MGEGNDGIDEAMEGSGGSIRGGGSVYTPKSIGNEFVKLVTCMTEMANKTRAKVHDADKLKEQLNKTSKTVLFIERPSYKEGKSSIKDYIDSLNYWVGDTFKKYYRNYGSSQAYFSMSGVRPNELTFRKPEVLLQTLYHPKWLDVGVLTDTKVGIMKGTLLDSGLETEPQIVVSTEVAHSSFPKEFISRALNLDGVSVKKDSNISYELGSKSMLESALSNPKKFEELFNYNFFSSEIKFEKEKTFAPDGTKTKKYGCGTKFNLSIHTKPVGVGTGPDTFLTLNYQIDANRLDLNLPDEELKWLEDAVNSTLSPLPKNKTND